MKEDRPTHMNSIALIAPYQEMAEIAGELRKEFQKPIVIEVGDLQEGLRKGQLLVERGVEVIISRGGTAQLLQAGLRIPVVEIKVTAYDIIGALQRVQTRGQKIGIIGFGNVIYGAHKLGDLLDLDLTVFTIQKEGDVPITLEEAKKKKVDIIIGDKVVVSHASKSGQKSVLIESGRESILRSFHEAYEILRVVRAEAQKRRQYVNTLTQLQAVLDSVEDQVVILDSRDRIQSCNPAALRMFKKNESQLQGLPLSLYPGDPLKEMKKRSTAQRDQLVFIQGKYVLVDYTPIETNGEMTGTLIVGRSISKLQQAERKIRNELHLKGHVARFSFSDILTEDDNFQRTINRAKGFSSSASTVLILGETGTGKEMFAQSIHNERFGPERPFVAINCATLPESLLESELFGYAEGAFTGAKKKGKKGFFELAHAGTILLDEIGELPLNLQSRLLRVIEEREVQPIGDDRVIPIDVRIIASTNKDLEKEVKEKRFRGDLFYRLNVLQLIVPPLRERGRDAFVLFRHFALQINSKARKRHLFSEEVEALLIEYQWPGNVRELRNLVERLAILTGNFSHSLQNVTEWIREELRKPVDVTSVDREGQAASMNLKDVEKLWIKQLYASSPLKKKELAEILGISRTTLWKKLKM
ncbi:MAG: sigma 54-interacting transcriptional regulator [Methanomassiliicoccales archaeon]|nr:MAG: sigma 54-interacting transcriptional regulator [Methanomassiliicoccales archaeon]